MSEQTSQIESPCIRDCCLDQHDICLGCFRTLDEIMQWSSLGDCERLQINQNAFARKLSRNKPDSVHR